MDIQKIGKNIAALRRGGGLTQEALAQRLGITPQAVSKWETGQGLPEASLLVELAGLAAARPSWAGPTAANAR